MAVSSPQPQHKKYSNDFKWKLTEKNPTCSLPGILSTVWGKYKVNLKGNFSVLWSMCFWTLHKAWHWDKWMSEQWKFLGQGNSLVTVGVLCQSSQIARICRTSYSNQPLWIFLYPYRVSIILTKYWAVRYTQCIGHTAGIEKWALFRMANNWIIECVGSEGT